MSGELTTKIRLVRCPKCRLVLPELPHYNVYKCGGCGTTLQAKKRKNEAANPETGARETDATLGNAMNVASEDKEFNNDEQPVVSQEKFLRAKTLSSSSGECSLDGDGGGSQNENGECNGEQPALPQVKVFSTKTTSSSSGECSLDGDGGSGQNENGNCNGEQLVLPHEKVFSTKTTTSSSLRECSLDGDVGSGQNENGNCNAEQLVLPQKKVFSTKTTSSSPGECSLDGDSAICQNENGECNGGQPVLLQEKVLSTRITSSSSGECSLDEDGAICQNEIGECNDEQPVPPQEKILRKETTSSSSREYSMDEDEGSDEKENGVCSGEKSIVPCEQALRTKTTSSSSGCSAELTQIEIKASSLAGAEESDDEILPSNEAEEKLSNPSDGVDVNNDKSALIEGKLESACEKESISVVIPCKSEEGIISSNPLSSPNKQMEEAQESIHHNRESVRSVDTFPELHLNPFDDTDDVADDVFERRRRKGKGPINSTLVPSGLPNGKHHDIENNKRSQHKELKTTRLDRPVRRWEREERQEFPPRMPFRRSGSQYGYESDISLSQMHDDEQFFSTSSVLSRDSYEDSDEEKMKLLRIIYKLQNQLNRTSSMNGRETNGRLSTGVSYEGRRIPTSHSHGFHEGRRFSHDLGDPWSDGRYNHGITNWRERSKISRIPFSAEARSSTHHMDNSCSVCSHQERRYSVEFPPHDLYQHQQYHHGHRNCCFSHSSYPSTSTSRSMGSRPPLYGRVTKPEDQRHRAHEMRMYLREKKSSFKRHFRPVAGGAPFVTCRNCFKLLQLPADFLLFKRVCHKLKCGSCSEILKFSLQDRSHIVSYVPSDQLGDDQSEVIKGGSIINMVSSSAYRANYSHSSHVVPVSFDDDYGQSLFISYSSEGDPVSLIPFLPLHGSEEKKIASRRHSRTSTVAEETYESTGVTSDVSRSEAPPRSSPLHQLMGYSSLSQVLRGSESFGEGNELMH